MDRAALVQIAKETRLKDADLKSLRALADGPSASAKKTSKAKIADKVAAVASEEDEDESSSSSSSSSSDSDSDSSSSSSSSSDSSSSSEDEDDDEDY